MLLVKREREEKDAIFSVLANIYTSRKEQQGIVLTESVEN